MNMHKLSCFFGNDEILGLPISDSGGIHKFPSSSKDIPENVPYLLIGGGTASFSAFRAIKAADPTAKVFFFGHYVFTYKLVNSTVTML